MQKLVKVLATMPVAACLVIGGSRAAAADPAPAKPKEQPAAGGEKSSAAPAPAPPGVPAETYDDPMGTVEAGPIAQSTTVRGKVDADLKGVWLLVARIQVAPEKFKSFPQIIKITQGKDGPEFTLLDVLLPPEIDKAVFDANNMTLSLWTPSEAVRKELGENWSKLPPFKLKTIDDFLYNKIEYTLVAPDEFDSLLGPGAKTSPGLTNVVKESRFLLKVVEKYKPRKLPPDSHAAQLMSRQTIYGAKSIEKGVIKGQNSLGFYAAGMGTPLPMTFVGPFEMYRLADLS